MAIFGGYGITPFGQSEFGNSKADIEPCFLISRPPDRSTNVPITQILRFITYSYASWVDISTVTVEISENAGGTYQTAFVSGAFVDPYTGAMSKVRRPEGHSLTFYIHKGGSSLVWPMAQKVIIRFTGQDEHDQQATKTLPVVW